MDQSYLSKPYTFIKPVRTTFWGHLLKPFYHRIMNGRYMIDRFDIRGTEHLRRSVEAKKGVLLSANHCRYSDPFVMGEVMRTTNIFLYFCASWHLFCVSKTQTWILRRMGAMSIYREGTDRECIRECQRVLEEAERPIVLFPEGTFYRQNDELGPLQDGVSFIARLTQKKEVRPIVIHPVAIKYWFTEDPTAAIEKRLAQLERRCHCHPKMGVSFVDRLKWIGNALLTVKEMEVFGNPQLGGLEERQISLANHICGSFEERYFGKSKRNSLMERLRLLRNHIVKLFAETPQHTPEWYELLYQIEDLAFVQQLFSHSWRYIDDWPSFERIAETLTRLEEDLYDEETPIAKTGVIIEFGEPIEVANYMSKKSRGEGDPITIELARRTQGMLDSLVQQGPPPSWNAPTGPGPRRSTTADEDAEVVSPSGTSL